MAGPNVLNPHPPEFDRFLQSSVGEDRNGYAVTVLSTFARLGLDPWKETAELATLGRDGARARLRSLLSRFRDVPALADDHDRLARDLSQLLPQGQTSGTRQHAASTAGASRMGTGGAIWTVLAIIFVLFQMFMIGESGSGE